MFTIRMRGPYPPVLMHGDDVTYAISGSHWVPILQDIRGLDVRFDWERPKVSVPVKPQEIRRSVPSSKGNKTYEVLVRSDGVKQCTCAGFTYRRRCRHIDELKKESGWK